jgi:hypothetical protein
VDSLNQTASVKRLSSTGPKASDRTGTGTTLDARAASLSVLRGCGREVVLGHCQDWGNPSKRHDQQVGATVVGLSAASGASSRKSMPRQF